MTTDSQKILDLLMEKLNTWWTASIKMLPNLVAAIVILIGFIFLARLLRNLSDRVLNRLIDHQALRALLSKVIFIAVILAGAFIALEILSLGKAVTSLLAGAGIIGLALGFAFQEIMSNFVSGVLIAVQKPYEVGDIVEVNGYMGRVEHIELRVTNIKTFQGLDVLVPNKTMYTEALINYTKTNKRRLDFEIGVSYGEDLDRVTEIAKDALKDVSGRTDDAVHVFFKEFGDSSINFVAQVWIEYPGQNYYWAAHHDVITKIQKAFNKNDITIPFPIRTLDFGIKGGTAMNKMLEVIVPQAQERQSKNDLKKEDSSGGGETATV